MNPSVVALATSRKHGFSKQSVEEVRVRAGFGIEGDAHAGSTVKHRSRVAVDPLQPNLRQVHLIHRELFDELRDEGFMIEPGQLGENMTTEGLALLDLPKGTRLTIGSDVVLDVTGLRNPCAQIERFRPGHLKVVLLKGADGALIRKAGVMATVRTGGIVSRGDPIIVTLPEGDPIALTTV